MDWTMDMYFIRWHEDGQISRNVDRHGVWVACDTYWGA